MAFALLIFGIVLLVSGIRNTQNDVFSLVKGDFTGPKNFIYWTMAILAIGSVGYIPKLKPLSDGFLVLVLIVLFVDNKGVFAQFTQAIQSTNTAPASTPASSSTSAAAVGAAGAASGIGATLQSIF